MSDDRNRPPIVFLVGPSGSGKSTLASWVTSDLRFLHLEIDRWPDGDGIDLEGLRTEWDVYMVQCDVRPLVMVLGDRIRNAATAGAILSFPGGFVPSPAQVAAAEQAHVSFVLLYGSGVDCLGAFLKREQQLNRGLGEPHWIANNACSYALFSSPRFDDCRLAAFANGIHRPRAQLIDEIAQRAG